MRRMFTINEKQGEGTMAIDLSKEELQTVKDWVEEHERTTELTKRRRPDVFDDGKTLKELVKETKRFIKTPEGVSATVQPYPLAKSLVDGRKVLPNIDNVGSIGASLDDYEVLDGIYEVPMRDFNFELHDLFYASDDIRRTKELAKQIEVSNKISPLIVVIDQEGPYVLEGAHRLGALGLLGAKSFPALIVLDQSTAGLTSLTEAEKDYFKATKGKKSDSALSSMESGDKYSPTPEKMTKAVQAPRSPSRRNSQQDMNRVLRKALAKVVVEAGARVDRLMTMFQFLPDKSIVDYYEVGPNRPMIPSKEHMQQTIKDKIREWKRADVLVWGLRKLRDFYRDLLKQREEGSFKDTPAILEGHELWKRHHDLKHYLGNARVNDYRSILDYRFPPNASVKEVMDTLKGLENAEKDKGNADERYLSEDDRTSNAASTLIKFPDGWVWDLLSTGYCEREGKAMKHCGNANHKDGDQILSLREPVKVGKEKMWKPHATFILNNGTLGEMKGFANEKPGKKLHPYIVKLLENDMVDFIKGGGYAPQNNFAIEDLDAGYLKELEEKKPSITMSMKNYFSKYKDTAKIAKYLKSLGVEKVEGNLAYLERYENIKKLAKGNNGLENALSNIDDPVDLMDMRVGDQDRENLLNDVEAKNPEKFKKLASLLPNYYEEDFKQFAEDTDRKDIAKELKKDPVSLLGEMMRADLLSDLSSSLTSAYLDGWQSGSYSALYNEVVSYLKNVEAGIFSLDFETEYVLDSPVWIVATVADVLDAMEDYDTAQDMVDREFDLGRVDFRYETEYDEDVAVEQFFELLHMPDKLLAEIA